MWRKYANSEKKMNNSFGISKAIYHDGSYLLLFGERILQSFGVYCE